MSARVEAIFGLVAADEPCRPEGATSVVRLCERARQGDVNAFGVLLSRFQHRAVATAWRLVGNREDALDVAQEAFLRAHKYLGSYNGRDDFGAWLHRIVVNASLALIERRKHQPAPGAGDAAAPDNPEEAAISRDAGRLFEVALGSLTAQERAAFVLRDIEGQTTEEVAALLGSSPATVRVHLCAARRKLRRAFEEAAR